MHIHNTTNGFLKGGVALCCCAVCVVCVVVVRGACAWVLSDFLVYLEEAVLQCVADDGG
jgi:hypothetical protein